MNGQGGARAGAGRKPAGERKRRTLLSVYVTPAQAELVRSAAQSAGKTVSTFLTEVILSHISNN